jgi:hypothetical protein
MCDELWAVEIDGEIIEGTDMLVASRGRLLYPMAGWTRPGRTRFVEACRDRAARIIQETPADRRQRANAFMGHMDSYLRLEWTQLGALCTAPAVASTCSAPDDAAAVRAVYRSERAWQSQWLIDNLGLALAAPRA